MTQLPLPIALGRRGEAATLLMTSANAQAIALLRDWRRWPAPATLLVGPSRSGRSLLGKLFLTESGGALIDDADQCSEQELFHRWNEARESDQPLLLIAREAPPHWAVTLPDLRTRLATAPLARIDAPDEEIASALIAHGLEQAASAFAPGLPEFVARRVTRCYETIDKVADRLNAESLASGRKLTVTTARTVLGPAGLLAGSDEEMDEGAGTGG